MNPTSPTRPRNALRWVLGVGLVFVVGSAMALQVARRRADERWVAMMLDLNDGWHERDVMRAAMPPFDVLGLPPAMVPDFYPITIRTHGPYYSDTSGGNIFYSWRQCRGGAGTCTLVLRQERYLFGSSIEAHLTGGEPALVDAVRQVLAAVDVELVVER